MQTPLQASQFVYLLLCAFEVCLPLPAIGQVAHLRAHLNQDAFLISLNTSDCFDLKSLRALCTKPARSLDPERERQKSINL